MPAFPSPPAWATSISTAGVTGTNGKTTTTSFIATALGGLDAAAACVTSVGSTVGTRSLGLAEDYDRFIEIMRSCHAAGGRFAAIELTSAALAAGFLGGWPCRVGVFTNLSLDHLDLHGSAEHYLASKAQLFAGLKPGGSAVLNACDPASALLSEVLPQGTRAFTYGVATRGPEIIDANLRATSVSTTLDGTRVELEVHGLTGTCPSQLVLRAVGAVHVENALAALLGAVALGCDPEDAARRIAAAPLPPGRFQVVHREPAVVVDYAHSPDALRRALETAEQACDGEVHLVLGVGGGPTKQKRGPLGAAASGASSVVVTSDNPRGEDPAAIADELVAALGSHPRVRVELDRHAAIEHALRAARREDLVLIAGKGHEPVQSAHGPSRPLTDAEIVRELMRPAPDA